MHTCMHRQLKTDSLSHCSNCGQDTKTVLIGKPVKRLIDNVHVPIKVLHLKIYFLQLFTQKSASCNIK